jgi:hypothetical protein
MTTIHPRVLMTNLVTAGGAGGGGGVVFPNLISSLGLLVTMRYDTDLHL